MLIFTSQNKKSLTRWYYGVQLCVVFVVTDILKTIGTEILVTNEEKIGLLNFFKNVSSETSNKDRKEQKKLWQKQQEFFGYGIMC